MPETIGWLYSIHPTQIELYALQLLLNHVKGPKSYGNIHTVTRESFIIHSKRLLLLLVWSRMIIYGLNV